MVELAEARGCGLPTYDAKRGDRVPLGWNEYHALLAPSEALTTLTIGVKDISVRLVLSRAAARAVAVRRAAAAARLAGVSDSIHGIGRDLAVAVGRAANWRPPPLTAASLARRELGRLDTTRLFGRLRRRASRVARTLLADTFSPDTYGGPERTVLKPAGVPVAPHSTV